MRFPRFSLCFDLPGDPGAGGGPASGASPAPAAPAPSPAPSGGAPGGGPSGAAPTGAPVPRQFSYAEDRSQWVPPYRLQEVSTRAQRLQQEYERTQQQIRALTGVGERPNPQHEEIRQALTQIAPELAPLFKNPKGLQKMLELVESGQLDTALQGDVSGWNRHAFAMTDSLVGKYAEAVGREAGALPPDARERLASQLEGFIKADRSGQRLQRYEMGDPTLIAECISDLVGFWVTPHRQVVQQQGTQLVQQNRRLPSQGVRGGVPQADPQKPTREQTSKAAREFVRRSMAG